MFAQFFFWKKRAVQLEVKKVKRIIIWNGGSSYLHMLAWEPINSTKWLTVWALASCFIHKLSLNLVFASTHKIASALKAGAAVAAICVALVVSWVGESAQGSPSCAMHRYISECPSKCNDTALSSCEGANCQGHISIQVLAQLFWGLQ
jgi:hypothetical protein